MSGARPRGPAAGPPAPKAAPGPTAAPTSGSPGSSRARRYGAAALSAVLLAAAFPPVGARPLAFVALAPWFAVMLRDRGRGHLGPGYVFGLLHFTLGLSWLFPLHPAFPPALAAILALYPLLLAAVVRALARGGTGVAAWALPPLWVAVDFLRERALTGFGYLFPGLVVAPWGTLRQAADLAGVPLLTAAIVLCNVAAAAALLRGPLRRRGDEGGHGGAPDDAEPCPRRPGVAAAGLLVALAAYGASRRGGAAEAAPGPRFLLVQPAFPLTLKADAVGGGNPSAARMLDEGARLTAEGLRAHPDTDVVAWAETMVPAILDRPPGRGGDFDEASARLLRALGALPGKCGAPGARFLGGALVRDPDGELRNAVLLLDPDGRPAARFDKVHLTPFGEYLPLIDLLPASARDAVLRIVAAHSPFIPRLAPGSAAAVPVPGPGGDPVRAGGLVCYEAVFPAEARRRVLDGAGLLVVPANYGWYGSWMHEQTLDILRLRAVECRRAVVSVTNDGPTVILDGDGEPTASLSPGVPAYLHASVPLDRRAAPSVRLGDAFPWACIAAVGGLALLAGVRRKETS